MNHGSYNEQAFGWRHISCVGRGVAYRGFNGVKHAFHDDFGFSFAREASSACAFVSLLWPTTKTNEISMTATPEKAARTTYIVVRTGKFIQPKQSQKSRNIRSKWPLFRE